MLDQYFGVKELSEVVLKARDPMQFGSRRLEAGEPVLYFENVNIAALNERNSTIMARGGWSNMPRVIWEDRSEVQFSLTEGVMSSISMGILLSSKVSEKREIEESLLVPKREGPFELEDGNYEVLVGSNAHDIHLKGSINVKGEKLPNTLNDDIYRSFLNTSEMSKETFEKVVSRKIEDYKFGSRPYTLETPIGEFNTFFGKIFKNYVVGTGNKRYKKANKIEDPLVRERERKAGVFIAKLMSNNSLRSLSFSSGGLFDYPLAEGILELSNGHLFCGLKKMHKKYKIEEK